MFGGTVLKVVIGIVTVLNLCGKVTYIVKVRRPGVLYMY